MILRIRKFLAESRQEFRHVNWPSREEALKLTGIVIAISLTLAVFLGFFDFIFLQLMEYILKV